MQSKGRVVVGLSGGVDSSVAAYNLIQEGYEVLALFMRNWHDDSVILDDECPWIEDSNDALAVAEALGIPFQVIDLSEAYKDRIVDYMFAEYKIGRTPNPDVLCNREIKFDVFLKAALSLNADFVATGHYCQRSETLDSDGNTIFHLNAGADTNKDQSYFLCQLSQEQLSKVLFPIGHMQKSDVRAKAHELGLVTAGKKDSQGLCFIGKVKLPDFLQQQLLPKRGKILEINSTDVAARIPILAGGENDQIDLQARTAALDFSTIPNTAIGEHNGAHYFTVGQRKGIAVGGKKEPLFVLGTDTNKNVVYVGEGKSHPALYKEGLVADDSAINWIQEDKTLSAGQSARYQVRIRYRQPLFNATLHQTEQGLYILFDEPQASVAAGQFVAWYEDNELIGSAPILY